MLVRSENRWLYRDVTRQTKNCSVWSAFESMLPLWWWPAHLSRDNSGGSATDTTAGGRHQPRVRQCFGQPSSSGPKEGSNHLWGARIPQREVNKDVHRLPDAQQGYPEGSLPSSLGLLLTGCVWLKISKFGRSFTIPWIRYPMYTPWWKLQSVSVRLLSTSLG